MAKIDFISAQKEDLTLSRAYEHLTGVNRKVADPRLLQLCPHFELWEARMYWMAKDAQTGEILLLEPSHTIPCGGPIGQEKTFN